MSEFEVKKDCFAYHETSRGGACNALNALYCKIEKCNFYKPVRTVCDGCPDKGQRYTNCKECKAKRKLL